MTDFTHDPARRSWVDSANGHRDFPLQNLPLGIFRPKSGEARGGVAIGDEILDLSLAFAEGLFSGDAEEAAHAASGPSLNPFMALGKDARKALRHRLSQILDAEHPDTAMTRALAALILHRAQDCSLELPAAIGDYTDFYAGIQHATNTGKLLRPDNPLMPNYKHIPVAYHGRSSSVVTSGTAVRRPQGQRKRGDEATPSYGPSRNLDYELELGLWIGPGNHRGEPIPIREAQDHIVGFCLLNDWSARDIQGWEYQPLGPFLGKSFSTTISPWVVTAEALEPFRQAQPARGEGDPAPLPYLWDGEDQRNGAFGIDLEVLIETSAMREKGDPAQRLSRVSATKLYWTAAQMVAHHSSGGCNLRPGDLFGSGTISGVERETWGSLLEQSAGGRQPLTLASGETRRFLEDGDEIVFRASCQKEGFVTIGFGECRGRIDPA